ncbi:hypothetical protein B296_00016713 [Ensete ventricosum]|uniref:Uncharacterized protein n=1 Tax=Ensete ventricosum TaxID=4639 RepID=A0A426ZFR7_ENSVE|nr:hypothetical protein B296_00016713 [Ensete ventricosum]
MAGLRSLFPPATPKPSSAVRSTPPVLFAGQTKWAESRRRTGGVVASRLGADGSDPLLQAALRAASLRFQESLRPGTGAKIGRNCILVHVPLESIDLQAALYKKGFSGNKPSLWAIQVNLCTEYKEFQNIVCESMLIGLQRWLMFSCVAAGAAHINFDKLERYIIPCKQFSYERKHSHGRIASLFGRD